MEIRNSIGQRQDGPRWIGFTPKDELYIAAFRDGFMTCYHSAVYTVVKKRNGETVY